MRCENLRGFELTCIRFAQLQENVGIGEYRLPLTEDNRSVLLLLHSAFCVVVAALFAHTPQKKRFFVHWWRFFVAIGSASQYFPAIDTVSTKFIDHINLL
jgi:hypothetical protein